MTFPREPALLKHWIGLYRDAWKAAGHPGSGNVMIAFHMFCAPTDKEAEESFREPIESYMRTLVNAVADWSSGTSFKDYPNDPKAFEALRSMTFKKLQANCGVWVGSPAKVRETIEWFNDQTGGFDVASPEVNSHTTPTALAEASMRLFAELVIPHFETLQVQPARICRRYQELTNG